MMSEMKIAADTAPVADAGADEAISVAIGQSSLGAVLVAATEQGLCAILLGDDADALRRDLRQRFPAARLEDAREDFAPVLARVVALIEAPARAVDFALDPRGTPFQHLVWQALGEIPAGCTESYGEIARRIGAPQEALAVGEACAANPLAVAIPCHRVVRKNGTLAGYRWGFRRKRALLAREAAG